MLAGIVGERCANVGSVQGAASDQCDSDVRLSRKSQRQLGSDAVDAIHREHDIVAGPLRRARGQQVDVDHARCQRERLACEVVERQAIRRQIGGAFHHTTRDDVVRRGAGEIQNVDAQIRTLHAQTRRERLRARCPRGNRRRACRHAEQFTEPELHISDALAAKSPKRHRGAMQRLHERCDVLVIRCTPRQDNDVVVGVLINDGFCACRRECRRSRSKRLVATICGNAVVGTAVLHERTAVIDDGIDAHRRHRRRYLPMCRVVMMIDAVVVLDDGVDAYRRHRRRHLPTCRVVMMIDATVVLYDGICPRRQQRRHDLSIRRVVTIHGPDAKTLSSDAARTQGRRNRDRHQRERPNPIRGVDVLGIQGLRWRQCGCHRRCALSRNRLGSLVACRIDDGSTDGIRISLGCP